MIKNFEGKVAVVTGAASGIGLSLAHAFAKRGMKIVIADINKNTLKKASKNLDKLGAEVLSLVIDVSDTNQVEDLAIATYERFGKANILCNNAGVGGGGPPHLLKMGDWNFTLGPNLFGVIHGIKSFLNRMFESKEPCHIVNTASVAGHLVGDTGPYSVSKFAVISMSEWLALSCFNTNVGISVLCPGLVNTNIFENSFLLGANFPDTYQPSEEEIAASLPFRENFMKLLGLGMDPDKVAEMVIYAIENDLFFIMTHPWYINLIKSRFDRIKEDASKISENFPPPVREIKETSYEYKSESLNFSISYPDYFIQVNPAPNTPQVFAASKEFQKNLNVSVSELDPNLTLDDTTKTFAELLKMQANNIKIVSDKQIKLSDGNIAREGEIEFQNFGFMKVLSHHISVLKDNKWIRVSTFSHPSFFDDELRRIGRSLVIKVPIAEVP